MFETVPAAPPDAILGINEAFQADKNPRKINLSVGVYKDEDGLTPILESVKVMERLLLKQEKSKSYLAITGHPQFGGLVPQLIFGEDHPAVQKQAVATAQTPGGTGALRVAADFIRATFPSATVWMSSPTWPNHPQVFQAAGLAIQEYPYYDADEHALDRNAMLLSLATIPAGDVLLLHGCCHNPTGVDLTLDDWDAIGKIVKERGILPLVDFAYQGFANGLEEDAAGIRRLTKYTPELIACASFSKNFGLYNERVGALAFVSSEAKTTQSVMSQAKRCIRTNYSNPPVHGAAIVAGILGDASLKTRWHTELAEMRNRIQSLRHDFADQMRAKKSPIDFSFITRQRGMFSFSGLSTHQVERLRDEHSIYIVRDGRINVAGLNSDNLPILCDAIIEVLGGAA